ncbi:MAG: 6-phosphogluconolactonase [Oleispira antarctica]|nr:6-phosphogluconolactonase [Oleispira antarctica]MBQ0794215.1 6-phosphogluconolactonase [Oleispira antarctica]
MWTETISDNADVLAKKLAVSVSKQLKECLAEKNKACLAVSGGTTPVEFFEQLSQQELDWAKVTVILVDERWLATDHKDSNEKLVRDHLIKNDAKQAYFLGLKNDSALPSEGIMDCETQLRTQIDHIDVVVLGMGTDGHTASWFTDSTQLAALLDSETSAWCLPVEDSFLPQPRMSLTWRFMKRAEKIYLHFTGEEKNKVFAQACKETSEQLPVSHILHQDGININVYRTQ